MTATNSQKKAQQTIVNYFQMINKAFQVVSEEVWENGIYVFTVATQSETLTYKVTRRGSYIEL